VRRRQPQHDARAASLASRISPDQRLDVLAAHNDGQAVGTLDEDEAHPEGGDDDDRERAGDALGTDRARRLLEEKGIVREDEDNEDTASRRISTSDVAVVSTGCPSLDLALGTGGLPRGRLVEVFGPESSGKTTLALHAIAQVQAEGGLAAFIDAEHAFDVGYARRLGVQVERLLVSQPDCGEQALEIVELLIRSGSIDLVVVDSVAALVPRAEIEGDMGDAHVGLQARLMSPCSVDNITATGNPTRRREAHRRNP